MSSPSTDIKETQVSTNSSDQPPRYEPATSSSAALRSEDTSISSPPLSFPTADATASEVRTYVRSFLWHNASKYDLSQDDVVRVAGAWRYGSGQELRSYDRSAWEGLFGTEIGLVLMKHVQEEIVKEGKITAARSYGILLRRFLWFSFIMLTIGLGTEVFWLIVSVLLLSLGGFAGFFVEVEDDEERVALRVFLTLVLFLPCSGMFIFFFMTLIKKWQLRRTADAKAKGDYVRLNEEHDAV